MQHSPSSSRARWTLAVVVTVACLAALELSVRLLSPQVLGASSPAPLIRGRFTQPGRHELRTAEFHVQVQVNASGFVDAPWPPRRDEVPRVVLIGDSFVQAAQVPLSQGLGRRLAADLSAARQAEVEVLSLGVPGAGTATALRLLEERALSLSPDVVVLGFVLSNDIMNNHPVLEGKTDKPFYRLEAGRLVQTDRVDVVDGTWRRAPLWRHSHAVRWAVRRWWVREATQRQLELGGGLPIPLRVHDPAPSPVWEEAWAVTEAMIAQMARRCEEEGVGFGVLLIPDAAQVGGQARARLLAQWPTSVRWDLGAATRRITALAAEYTDVHDLQPAFESGGPGLYFEVDGHWTASGHALAARDAQSWVSGLLDQGHDP